MSNSALTAAEVSAWLEQFRLWSILQRRGEADDSRQWLGALPQLIVDHLRDNPHHTLEHPLSGGVGSFVFFSRWQGAQAVTKFSPPGPIHRNEVAALALAADCAATVYAADLNSGMVVLERLGEPLKAASIPTREKFQILLEHLLPLWRELPEGHGLLSAQEWATDVVARATRYHEELGRPCSQRVMALMATLAPRLAAAAEQSPPCLLMADPHAGNLLAAGAGEWKWIDVRGLAGPPVYDLVQLVLRDLPEGHPTDLAEVLAQRCQHFAQVTGVPAQQIWSIGIPELIARGLWRIHSGSSPESGYRLLKFAEGLPEELPLPTDCPMARCQ